MPSSARKRDESADRRILAWRKRFDAVRREVEAGSLTDEELRERADELETERDALLENIGKPTPEQVRLLEVALHLIAGGSHCSSFGMKSSKT